MTGREILNRKTRRVMRLVYFGVAICAVAIAGGASVVFFMLLLLFPVGFIIAFAGIWFGHCGGIACPWCQKSLFLLHQGGLTIGDDIVSCPYCNHKLDEDLSTSVEATLR